MERQGALFTGVCSQDGCGQAPRDGFMASREKGILSQNMLLNIRGNQVNFYGNFQSIHGPEAHGSQPVGAAIAGFGPAAHRSTGPYNIQAILTRH